MSIAKPPISTDALFDGKIRIRQERYGYRFSIDAVLLAAWAAPRPGERILDLGAGCGVISLLIAYRRPESRIFGVEVQPELAALAERNVADNHMQERVTVLCEDLKMLHQGIIDGPVDLVLSNPPYRKVRSGRINPNRQRAVARHEIKAVLRDVVETAGRMLNPGGRFAAVYPAERVTDLLTQMRLGGIEPKRLQTIQSTACTGAKLIQAEGRKGARPGARIEPPLIIYDDDGHYSPEVAAMFRP